MSSAGQHSSTAELLQRYDFDDSGRSKASGWTSLQKSRSSKRRVMPHSSSDAALQLQQRLHRQRPTSAYNSTVTARPIRAGVGHYEASRPYTATKAAANPFQR